MGALHLIVKSAQTGFVRYPNRGPRSMSSADDDAAGISASLGDEGQRQGVVGQEGPGRH
jgi:hypothetical protein